MIGLDDMDVNAHLNIEMVMNDVEQQIFNDIICYDSEGDSSQENERNDPTEMPIHSVKPLRQEKTVSKSFNRQKGLLPQKKSNAEQMRKYRAKQRSDPIRYQMYLEKERIRNHRRKYEKRMKAAQERALELGLPYIVLEPFPPEPRRGRKPKFPRDETLLFPVKIDELDQESNSFHMDYNDDMPTMPVEVELTESNEIYIQKPNISVVNIDKLTNHSRPALQILMPQEVSDRERVSNFVKLDHDYVRTKTELLDEDSNQQLNITKPHSTRQKNKKSQIRRDELLKLQEQCRSFISKPASPTGATSPILRKSLNSSKAPRRRTPHRFPIEPIQYDSGEHEDLDDLFKELEEVANKEKPKKRKSKTSPCKAPGEFSLTVEMPVQPIVTPKTNNNVHLKQSEDVESKSNNICDDEMRWWSSILQKSNTPAQPVDDVIDNIKKEPISSALDEQDIPAQPINVIEKIKEEPASSDNELDF